jgi:flagellar motor switch protein FliM
MQGGRVKLGAAGSAPRAGAAESWTAAVERTAQGQLGLDLSARSRGGETQPRALAELLEMLPERALIGLVEGPAEALGLIALAPPVMAGLIEQQALGRVGEAPVAVRRPTRADAALVAGFVDGCLETLDVALAETADRVWAAGFRYASFLDEPRALAGLLDEDAYRVLGLDVSLAGGRRAGSILLALPAEGRGQPPARGPAPDPAASQAFRSALDEQVMAAPAMLDAVIARVTLPLSAVLALRAGDWLRLGPATLDRIDVQGLDGRRLCGARLGQSRGMRALRLAEAALPAGRSGSAPLVPAPAEPPAPPEVRRSA